MNKIYQSTKSGRQIDATVDTVKQHSSNIENILTDIQKLKVSKAEKDQIPQKLSDLIDDTTEHTYDSLSTKPQSGKAVAEAIAKLLGSAPENLDTLEELAKALDEDENFSATVIAEIAKKVDKVEGKVLSSNDFTDEDKKKLDDIEDGANKTTVDTELSSTSTNPVQNKVVTKELNKRMKYILNTANTTHGIPLDIDFSVEGLKAFDLRCYGKTTQTGAATFSNPVHLQNIDMPTGICISAVEAVDASQVLEGRFEPYKYVSMRSTSKHRDETWIDFNTKKLIIKRNIKSISLSGDEEGAWFKPSTIEGCYFVQLNEIPGMFTDEELEKLQKGEAIAYADCKTNIGSICLTNRTPTADGEFRIKQKKGAIRFYFFTSEYSTLEEVKAALKNRSIIVHLAMIDATYDEYTYKGSESVVELFDKILSSNLEALCIYYGSPNDRVDTQATYLVDVGKSLQIIKDNVLGDIQTLLDNTISLADSYINEVSE